MTDTESKVIDFDEYKEQQTKVVPMSEEVLANLKKEQEKRKQRQERKKQNEQVLRNYKLGKYK